ncbi:3'-5' exonuclease [Candidatus Mycalebacterium sp.]
MSDFVAIDVETANRSRGSICQIGIVEVRNGIFADEWSTLVNPEEHFEEGNIRIHGIYPEDVANAPTFADISETLRSKLQNRIVISHTFFDLEAVRQAKSRYGISGIGAKKWLDSRRFAYRAFNLQNGAALKTLCNELDISFNHHEALSDAKACAQVVLKACERGGFAVADFA